MEDAAAKALEEVASQGKTVEAVQQAYTLASYAYEQILQVHILVNTSLADHDPSLLLAGWESSGTGGGRQTFPDKITATASALQNLRAGDKGIAYFADNIQGTLPLFQENIDELAEAIRHLAVD